MEIFRSIAETLRGVPAWVSLLLIPALLLPAAVTLALVGRRGWYPPVACFLGACGSLFLPSDLILFYAMAFCAAATLFSAFLLLPKVGSKRRRETEEKLRRETVPPALSAPAPPMVRCFGEEPRDCGLQLAHARALLDKLRASKLSATDRLETDAIARSLEGYGGRALTGQEADFLNDRLASVLKLTAKYKL